MIPQGRIERKSPELELTRSGDATGQDCLLIARNLPFHLSEQRRRLCKGGAVSSPLAFLSHCGLFVAESDILRVFLSAAP